MCLKLASQTLENGFRREELNDWVKKMRKDTSSMRQYRIWRMEHRILMLKSLMGHMKCTNTEENMLLSVPIEYPANNHTVTVINWLQGEWLEYPKHILPMWSIWGTKSDIEDIKMRLCSAAKVYHALCEMT